MREARQNDPMTPTPYRVLEKRREQADSFTLELASINAGGGQNFRPGQFNMLYVFGVGEVPISISGDPANADRLVHTIRNVGGVTNAMAGLNKGDVIGVRGPFGSAWPVKEAEGDDVVIIAGGVGLAPLRPAIHHVLTDRSKYGRFVILYGARTPRDIMFMPELMKWRGRVDTQVEVTVDRTSNDWSGNVGAVTKLIPRADFDRGRATVLVCGPEIMMRFAIAELDGSGVSKDSIYVSMERNMKCAVGFCGHCQFGGYFVCRDGPVFPYGKIEALLKIREL